MERCNHICARGELQVNDRLVAEVLEKQNRALDEGVIGHGQIMRTDAQHEAVARRNAVA